MRMSDWSSDVCSSDLSRFLAGRLEHSAHHCQVCAARRAALCRRSRDLRPDLVQMVRKPADSGSGSPERNESGGPALYAAGPAGPLKPLDDKPPFQYRSEEHTSELQSLMRI